MEFEQFVDSNFPDFFFHYLGYNLHVGYYYFHQVLQIGLLFGPFFWLIHHWIKNNGHLTVIIFIIVSWLLSSICCVKDSQAVLVTEKAI